MRSPTWFALLCLSLLLVIIPLTVVKPGLPMTLKADEPAYYLMALSLAKDFDLQCELHDLGRLFDEYPYLATFNLILMTDDGWNSVFFGKPYIYSLFAAPFAGVFGANGMVAFNMALLLAMIWMGAVYLQRFNSTPMAGLFSVGFFLLSSGFAYVFWLHPEIFNMVCVAASLFLILHQFSPEHGDGRLAGLRHKIFGPNMRPAWSGAILALAAYNKPMLIAMALPSLFSLFKERRLRSILVWLAAAATSLAIVCGVAVFFTGHPSAYLGVERMGVQIFDPQQMPVQPVESPLALDTPTTNSWSWLVRVPEIDGSELVANVGYFIWGRHMGIIPYMPFAILSLLLFLLNRRDGAVRWVILGSLTAVGLFFLIWIPFNWHGGGGFVGNRYFVNVYPAFLFLVTTIRPGWFTAIGYALAGLFVGPLLFTPFGAPVPEPTLQAHVRSTPLRWFPLELGFRRKLPGYKGFSSSGAWFFGRKDSFETDNDDLLIHGATPVELWMFTQDPLTEEVFFVVENFAKDNLIKMDLAGSELELDFSGQDGPSQSRKIELVPGPPYARVKEGNRKLYAYRLRIRSRTGFIANAAQNAVRKFPVNDFYVGARLTYLGPKSSLESDMYSVDWGECQIPNRVIAGEIFVFAAELTNSSGVSWPASGPTQVNLAYHWLDSKGDRVETEERRTDLPRDVPPGRKIEVEQTVVALPEPGEYTLVLDLVRERVSWFSQKRSGSPCEAEVEIVRTTQAGS
jgi:hypothetical protein